MASSKILPGCLVSLTALVVFYLSWVALPSVGSEDEVKKLLARQQQAFEEDQKQALDASQNAFIDPQLSPYWGRKSVEHKPHSHAEDVISALRAFGFLGNQSASDSQLSKLWKGKDASLRQAVADFEALRPTLSGALHRSRFIIPQSERPHFESEISNYLAQRSIAQALSAYAEVQLANGKPSAALEAALDIFALARLVVSQRAHPLMITMIGSALQVTAQETLSFVLQSHSGWSEAELTSASRVLDLSAADRELGLEAMGYELWVAQNSFARGPQPAFGTGPLMHAPGVWQREWRLFQNDFYPFLKAARARQPVSSGWLGQSTFVNWLMGQHSLTSPVLIPNFDRVMSLLELARQRQDFLHLYVQLLLQKRRGGLPKELSGQELGKLDPKRLNYRVEKGEPHLEYVVDPALATSLPQLKGQRSGASRWENLMHAHWAIPVAP